MVTSRHPSPGPTPRWVGLLTAGAAVAATALVIQYVFDVYSFRRADAAYNAADCETAIARFRTLAEGRRLWDFNDFQSRAAARIQTCEAFLAAIDPAPAPPLQLLARADFIDRYIEGPLVTVAREQTIALATDTPPETLAAIALCDRLADLSADDLIPAEPTPPLLQACGQTYQAEGQLEAAIAVYQQVLSEYPDHAIVPGVETALAQSLLAQAKAEGSGDLGDPGFSGYTADGTTVVEIRNDSPEKMRIVFSGPEPRFEEIEPCTECETYTGEGPADCPNLGPVQTFTLEPGDYEVLVRSISDPSVTPFTGAWSLADGREYNSCFYLVNSLLPDADDAE
ncbi:MAG: tetratricopeptide repeat protein [Leptolyngbya sp.]|nr:tetratricopeptide repeat protein [Leptolyngbya sp.]